MNAQLLNTVIGHAIQRAVNEGIPAKTINVPEIVGILEMQKGELLRWSQDAARAKAIPAIVNGAGIKLPPAPMGN